MKYILLVLMACLISNSAWAGWVTTYKDSENGKKSYEYYEKGKANFGELIFTGKKFILVNPDAKAYWEGTPEQYCKAMDSQRKMMEKQMANMPAQYKPVPISKKKVTRKELGKQKIAGFSAKGYEFYVDGRQDGRIWVSSDSRLSGIIDFENSMLEKTKCFEGLDSTTLEGSALYKKTVKNKVILKESHRQVVSIEKKSIPAARFEAPAGYKSFSDYDQFMKYLMSHAGSGSGYSSGEPSDYLEKQTGPPQQAAVSAPENQREGKGNVIAKDTKDIANDTADDAHQAAKDGVQKGISKKVKKGIKGAIDKLFKW